MYHRIDKIAPIFREISMRKNLFIITPKKCIYWILYACVLFSAAYSLFGISLSTFYICDILNLMLLYFEIKYIKKIKKECKLLLYILTALLLSLLIGVCINSVKPLLIFWGLRNLCRFFILFFGVIFFFSLDDVERVIRFYFIVQIFNTVVGLYKYFVLGLFSDDFGGGIFWGGGGLNPFCLLLLCFYSNLYFRKKTTLKKFGFIVAVTFMLGAMAEEKMMIMLAVLCILLSAIINQCIEKNFTVRKVTILIGVVLGFVVVINVVNYLAPDMLSILLNKKNFMNYASATFDEGYRIPRVGSFGVINKLFLRTSIKELFGLGIGNCDTSTFSLFQSDFYRVYGDYNYRWFTNQWTYLECGIIGFGLYLLFFVALIVILLGKLKKNAKAYQPYMITSAIFTVSMIFLMWQSSAIRIDTAYLIYFGMAIGFVAIQHGYKEKKGGGAY